MKKEKKAPIEKTGKTPESNTHDPVSGQIAEKIYNIEKIETANFGFTPPEKVLNQHLTRQLLLTIREYHPKIEDFLGKIPIEFEDNWQCERTFANQAKGLLQESFVWIIGWQLRRLFAIGNRISSQEQTNDYLEQCILTFKLIFQIINFSLLSQLWDHIKNKKISLGQNKEAISFLFSSKIPLRPDQYIDSFKALLNVFSSNQLPLPYEELSEVEPFIDSQGEFTAACTNLIGIRDLFNQSKHKTTHCFTAEENLATILKSFSFLANFQLVSMKKIEYEWQRNNAPRYIRDFNILGKKQNDSKDHQRLLKYSSEPFNTFAVFIRAKTLKLNLFPFVLDFNAFIDAEGSKIGFLEHRTDTGLNYSFIDDNSSQVIKYHGIIKEESTDQIILDEQQLDLKLDSVILQFLDAQTTIMGSSYGFRRDLEEESDFGNL